MNQEKLDILTDIMTVNTLRLFVTIAFVVGFALYAHWLLAGVVSWTFFEWCKVTFVAVSFAGVLRGLLNYYTQLDEKIQQKMKDLTSPSKDDTIDKIGQ